MKVSKFIKKKNKIVKAVTGVILVPDGQVTNMTYKPELDCDNARDAEYLHSGLCPYCVVYLNNDEGRPCIGCPMHTAGNQCQDPNSTWHNVNKRWTAKASPADRKALFKLVKKFNKGRKC